MIYICKANFEIGVFFRPEVEPSPSSARRAHVRIAINAADCDNSHTPRAAGGEMNPADAKNARMVDDFASLVESADPDIYELRTHGPGPSGSLPLTPRCCAKRRPATSSA